VWPRKLRGSTSTSDVGGVTARQHRLADSGRQAGSAVLQKKLTILNCAPILSLTEQQDASFGIEIARQYMDKVIR
jgi:hypothetical protein